MNILKINNTLKHSFVKTINFGENTIFLPKVDSTNLEAWRQVKERELSNGTMIWTSNQYEGKGAANSIWSSDAEKNLTLSFIIYPDFLEIEHQFYLNMLTSLAIRETIEQLLENKSKVYIKWPNDIIVNNGKVSGMLIENSIYDSSIKTTIIGIGINVNQTIFPENIKNPTSLKLISNKETEIFHCASVLCNNMKKWHSKLTEQKYSQINQSYHNHLYLINQENEFIKDNKVFKGIITGISEHGKLKIQTSEKNVSEFAFKEVEYLL